MDKVREMIRKLDQVRNLPTLPVVIDKLRYATRDPDFDAARIAGIIQDDPSMMARILRVVNSVLYRGLEPVNTLPSAVSRMGLNAISNIAMATAIFSLFGKSGEKEFDREEFWRHSISTGIAICVLYDQCESKLAKRYGKDILHLVGLLHDIGKIVLDQFFHDEFVRSAAAGKIVLNEFVRSVNVAKEKSIPLIQAEKEVMGADHVRIGAWLGMRWNLSQEMLQVIRWHHDPDSSDREHRELVMLCHLANYICNIKRIGDGGDTAAPVFQQDVWTKLGLSVRDIPDIVDEVVEESKQSEILMSFVP
jgi:HD-like signal output (HDOD) protein